MERYLFQLILMLSVHMISAQNMVTLYGHINHPKGKNVYIKYYSDYVSFNEITGDSGIIDKKGNFSMRFNWEHSYPATFFHGDEITEMFLSPNDSLKLSLDTKHFDETVVYEGRGALVNNYLAKKTLLFPAQDGSAYKLNEQAFTQRMDSIHKKEVAFFKDYFSKITDKDNSVLDFMTNEEFELHYSWVNDLMYYPELHTYVTQLKSPVTLSPNYYDFLKLMPIYNPLAMGTMAYPEFIANYVNTEVRKTVAKDTTLSALNTKEQFIQNNLNGTIKEFVLANWSFDFLTEANDLEHGKKILNELRLINPKSKYLGLLENTLSLSMRLQPGNPAPIFTFPDLKGRMVSLSDFKGKIVYLDIWASWCGPCRHEIPFAQKLEEDFRDKNIIFLSVSIDEDIKAWKKIIKDKQMKGVQLISTGNFDSVIAQLYNVKGIPQYIIIDKDGKIVNSNADRPSGDVKEDLASLLK